MNQLRLKQFKYIFIDVQVHNTDERQTTRATQTLAILTTRTSAHNDCMAILSVATYVPSRKFYRDFGASFTAHDTHSLFYTNYTPSLFPYIVSKIITLAAFQQMNFQTCSKCFAREQMVNEMCELSRVCCVSHVKGRELMQKILYV